MIVMIVIVTMPMSLAVAVAVAVDSRMILMKLHHIAIRKRIISPRTVLFNPCIGAVHDGMGGMRLQLRDDGCGHHEQHGEQSGPYRRGLDPARSSRPRHPKQARKGRTISFMTYEMSRIACASAWLPAVFNPSMAPSRSRNS